MNGRIQLNCTIGGRTAKKKRQNRILFMCWVVFLPGVSLRIYNPIQWTNEQINKWVCVWDCARWIIPKLMAFYMIKNLIHKQTACIHTTPHITYYFYRIACEFYWNFNNHHVLLSFFCVCVNLSHQTRTISRSNLAHRSATESQWPPHWQARYKTKWTDIYWKEILLRKSWTC